MPMQAQEALETATCNAIKAITTYPTTGYPVNQCQCMYDGQPPPLCPLVFVSVWSRNGRRGRIRTALEERYDVFVTITVRCIKPFDRWLEHRRDLEKRSNAIRALIGIDTYNHSIINAANVLGPFDGGISTPNSNPAGFHEGLWFKGADDVEEKGTEWFSAAPGKLAVGLVQTLNFLDAVRVQAWPTAT